MEAISQIANWMEYGWVNEQLSHSQGDLETSSTKAFVPLMQG
jgi:hypothetical protein